MAKKDNFDVFLEKNFAEGPRVKIARPVGGERDTSYEERMKAAKEQEQQGKGGEAAVVAEEVEDKKGEGSEANAQVEGSSAQPAVQSPEPARRGRPKTDRGPVMNMNFLLEVEVKQKLERLKMDLYRSSVSDLIKEAIHDLFVKYNVADK